MVTIRATPAAAARATTASTSPAKSGKSRWQWLSTRESGMGRLAAGEGSGSVGPRLGGRRIDLQQGIEDHLGGVKVDRAGVGGAPGELGDEVGPEPALRRGGAEPVDERGLGGRHRRHVAARGGAREAAEGEVDEVEGQRVAQRGVAAGGGLGERDRPAAVEPGSGGEELEDLGVEGEAVAGDEAVRGGDRAAGEGGERRGVASGPGAAPAAASAAASGSGPSGRRRSSRQRERSVGSSAAGRWQTRRSTARAGGSSRIFRSALAAAPFSSSAASTMATRRPPSAAESWKKLLSARTSSTVIAVRRRSVLSSRGRRQRKSCGEARRRELAEDRMAGVHREAARR